MDGVHSILILDDFATVQAAVESSDDNAKILKRRGMDDPKKIVKTSLTVSYLGGDPNKVVYRPMPKNYDSE
jgi:primary-amine oxidase